MKKAIVVGGTSGIGEGLVNVLLEQDYNVAITGVEEDIISSLKDKNKVIAKHLNCIETCSVKKLNILVEKLGGLDLLVFSAGIGNLNKNLGHEVENNANKLNVLAFTEIADWSYRFFEKQGHGHFAAVSSISGLFGSKVAPAYHAAKAYQINYLEGLRQKARQTKKPIYITDIRPGYVKTPITEGKKMFWAATPDKVAKQIFTLLENKKAKGYVTKRWRLVAGVIKTLPPFVRKRM